MQRFETRFTGKITSINVSGIQRTDCRNAMQQPEIMSLMCVHQPSTMTAKVSFKPYLSRSYRLQYKSSLWFQRDGYRLLVGSRWAFCKLTAAVYLEEGNKRPCLFVDIPCHDNLIILCNNQVIISKGEITIPSRSQG